MSSTVHTPPSQRHLVAIVAYLLILGIGSAALVIGNMPSRVDAQTLKFAQQGASGQVQIAPFDQLELSQDQALMLLAMLAGIAGSFLHAAQSLASFVGNQTYKTSWALWYLLRPWIGGILGLALFAVFAANLVRLGEVAPPNGVVAIGLLGGWFSKATSDKLEEVFKSLLNNTADAERKNKLNDLEQPTISAITPTPVTAEVETLRIEGTGFQPSTAVQLDDHERPEGSVTFHSAERLDVSLIGWAERPTAAATVSVRVRNAEGSEPLSSPFELSFAGPTADSTAKQE